MKSPPLNHFRPRDGALLDLETLDALAASPDRILSAYLNVSWPGASCLVLDGLELKGEWSSAGPPGTVRPDSEAPGITVSAGTAIVTDVTGNRYLVHVEEELRAEWPTKSGSSVRGVLVLIPRVEPAKLNGDVAVARETIQLEVGFVKPEQAAQSYLVPLAQSLGNGRDWTTDIQRVWQPEHDAIRILMKRFEELEQLVWKAEPEGAVWERQMLGRNWVRYQTVAASSLQAARMFLETRPSSTLDRVRILKALKHQLKNSVERAATELMQMVGPPEGAGPYVAILEEGS